MLKTDFDSVLCAEDLTVRYGRQAVLSDLSVDIPRGRISVIVGPNASGKSTLLRALSRLVRPTSGRVLLDGKDIRLEGAKALARSLAHLPQTASAPFGMKVADLVARSRYPHQTLLQQWSEADARAVADAMEQTQVADLAQRSIDELSGGQRQRVWLALALAQDTPTLLLDEPTTYLDVAHQLEVLNLCRRLNQDQGKTLVMVLHDLNQAARYGDHVIALRDGAIAAAGPPNQVLTPERIEQVFGVRCVVTVDPGSGAHLIVPTAVSTAPSLSNTINAVNAL
jgi:ABC-type cobalamin/Fe3+-siderophores transport system ATPase subunit